MTYLVDTDVVVSFLNGRSDAISLINQLRPLGLWISLPTYGEILEGIFFGRNPTHQEGMFQNFLIGAEVLPLGTEIMQRFARIRGELRSRGQLIPDMDLLIAATALEKGLILVTRNRQHFDRVPSLQIYDGL